MHRNCLFHCYLLDVISALAFHCLLHQYVPCMAIVLSIFQLHSPIYPHLFTDLGEDYDDYDGLVKKGATQEQLADARLRGYLLSPQDAHVRKHPPVNKWKVGNAETVLQPQVSSHYLVNTSVNTVC